MLYLTMIVIRTTATAAQGVRTIYCTLYIGDEIYHKHTIISIRNGSKKLIRSPVR